MYMYIYLPNLNFDIKPSSKPLLIQFSIIYGSPGQVVFMTQIGMTHLKHHLTIIQAHIYV